MNINRIMPFVLPFLVVGCSRTTKPALSSTPPLSQHITVSEWDKVKINSSGEIYVNKKQVSLAEFAAECQRLKQVGGAAVVYTGDGGHALTPAQIEAVHKLIALGVPMKTAMKESDLN